MAEVKEGYGQTEFRCFISLRRDGQKDEQIGQVEGRAKGRAEGQVEGRVDSA